MSTVATYLKMKAPGPRIITLKEMASALADEKGIIQAVMDGFVAYTKGAVSVPSIQTMGQPPLANFIDPNPGSQTCIKSGYVNGDEHMVVKIAPGSFTGNLDQGLSPNTGLNLIFSQTTGRVEAVMLDEGT